MGALPMITPLITKMDAHSADYLEKSIKLQKRILNEEYYIDRYIGCMKKHGFTTGSVILKEHTKIAMCNMWNDFWFALPDSPVIRQGPFFDLCDLAEEIFETEPAE